MKKSLPVLLAWLFVPAFSASIDVRDTIKTDADWGPDTVRVMAAVTIADGVTVTVFPGTRVEFQGHFKLNVQGRILAEGLPADSIVFTANDTAAGWHGLRFDGTSAANDTSRLVYCRIEYGRAAGSNEDAYGGGIFVSGFSKLVVARSAIVRDSAAWTGGGIYCENGASPVIADNLIAGNGAQFGGGVLCHDNCSPVILNNVITGNRANRYGGGVYFWRSAPVVTGNLITGNRVNMYGGGGVFCQNNAFPVLTGNTISRNYAPQGGGLYIEYHAAPVMVNNIVDSNSAQFGGGIYSDSSSPVMINNTVTRNYTSWRGGGLYLYKSALVSTNNTMANNRALREGAGIYCNSTWSYVPSFTNTILWGNAGLGGQVYLYDTGSRPSFQYCDIEGGRTGFAGPGGANYAGTYQNNLEVYPQFKDTAAGQWSLLQASPCINAGTPDTAGLGLPGLDLAGNPRIREGRVDIGAYEFPEDVAVESRAGIAAAMDVDLRYSPNPFNAAAAVTFTLPGAGQCALKIFDPAGKVVAVLVNGVMPAGRHRVRFDAAGLPSGTYMCRFAAGGKTLTRTTVLVK